MALVRYEPWTVMSQLQEEIQRAFSNATDTGPGSNSSSATADWTPAVDIAEYQDQFELFIDLPGVDANSVEISLDNDVLTLSGERPVEKRLKHLASMRSLHGDHRRVSRSIGEVGVRPGAVGVVTSVRTGRFD